MPASLGVHGPGEMQMRSGFNALDLVDGDLVVSLDHHLDAELAEILDEVVGEGVVVIDDEHHGVSPSTDPARSMARIIPMALLTVSWYSPSGVESATTPPPACT